MSKPYYINDLNPNNSQPQQALFFINPAHQIMLQTVVNVLENVLDKALVNRPLRMNHKGSIHKYLGLGNSKKLWQKH